MNGIKNALALVVLMGTAVVGLTTCAGVKPAHAGEVKWKIISPQPLGSVAWQFECISDCTEAGNAAAPMPPTPKSAKWSALLPRGKWKVAWQAGGAGGAGGFQCKGSRTITTCAKLGTCLQEFESHCP